MANRWWPEDAGRLLLYLGRRCRLMIPRSTPSRRHRLIEGSTEHRDQTPPPVQIVHTLARSSSQGQLLTLAYPSLSPGTEARQVEVNRLQQPQQRRSPWGKRSPVTAPGHPALCIPIWQLGLQAGNTDGTLKGGGHNGQRLCEYLVVSAFSRQLGRERK